MNLPRIFSRGMVVQQDMPIPVWGWSSPHQRVVVSLGGRTAETQADAKGGWMVKLPKLQARDHLGAGLSLHIAADQELTIDEVAVGEVWLCAGYDALPWMPMGGRPAADARGDAGERPLRLFSVAPAAAPRPLDDVASTAGWQACSPRALDAFASLAGAFAGSLQAAIGVPFGLILTRTASETVESWISRAALAGEHQLRGLLERAEQAGAGGAVSAPAYRKLLRSWQEKALHQDPGNRGVRRGWHQPEADEGDWRPLDLPGRWSSAGYFGAGALWLRRTVALPAAWKGRALVLSLGAVEDADRTYVQGTLVGASADDAPAGATRAYAVPSALVRGAALTIAVRVFAHQRPGGLVGAPDELSLALAEPPPRATRACPAAIPLDGPWRCRAELELPLRDQLPPPPLHDRHPEVPAALNNGMIQPLVPYGLRGGVWLHAALGRYKPEQYRALVATLIRDWRTAWGQGEFPVAVVQLPGACPPELREAQRAACQLANTGLVTAIDLPAAAPGQPSGVEEAGRRLALWARATVHREATACSGPGFASCAKGDATLIISFSDGEGLRTSDGNALRGFAVAGADRRFVPAEARIEHDTVVLSASGVAAPQAVRYAWAELPDGNLCNRAGLPAAPFRTDFGVVGGGT